MAHLVEAQTQQVSLLLALLPPFILAYVISSILLLNVHLCIIFSNKWLKFMFDINTKA